MPSDQQPRSDTNSKLQFLQYNLHKSGNITNSVLNDPRSKRFAALLLQEQYWLSCTESSPMHHSWTLIEPISAAPGERPRAAIYVNNRILPTASFKQVHLTINDVTAITTMQTTLVINVYNRDNPQLIPGLWQLLRQPIQG